jgi:hypothetical protein
MDPKHVKKCQCGKQMGQKAIWGKNNCDSTFVLIA